MKARNWTFLLLVGGFILSLASGFRDRLKLQDAFEEIAELSSHQRTLATFKKAFLKQMTPEGWGTPFLESGSPDGNPGEVIFREPVDLVLYLLSTDCPICSSNFGLLNEIAESGVPVVGIAIDSIRAEVEEYRLAWNLQFPVLVDASGSAVGAVPRYGTPTTVAVSDGKVVFLEFGELGEESAGDLWNLSQEWTR